MLGTPGCVVSEFGLQALTSLPGELGDLPNLTELDLSYNDLRTYNAFDMAFLFLEMLFGWLRFSAFTSDSAAITAPQHVINLSTLCADCVVL